MKFPELAITVVRLWHNVLQWEPGIVRIRTDFFGTQAAQLATGVRTSDVTKLPGGTDNFRQPAFEIWYAPTTWGGRGFTCCSSLSLFALDRAMKAQPASSPTLELFAQLTTMPRPSLVVSTKACTARSEIPPFLDDDGCSLMRVQMDWAIQSGMVDVTQRHSDNCNGVRECSYFGASDAQDAFRLLTLWRERELREDIARLKAQTWGDRLVADPRKVTLAGRSSRRKEAR